MESEMTRAARERQAREWREATDAEHKAREQQELQLWEAKDREAERVWNESANEVADREDAELGLDDGKRPGLNDDPDIKPLVLGGQGRGDDESVESGLYVGVCFLLLVVAILLLAGGAVAKWIAGMF